MPLIKLHLFNRTNFNLIFDYKRDVYFVPFNFDMTIEVESGSLLYVHPDGKPEGYRHLGETMESDASIECRFELGKIIHLGESGLESDCRRSKITKDLKMIRLKNRTGL